MVSIGMARIDLENALRPFQPVRTERVEAVAFCAVSETARALWIVSDFMDFDLYTVNTLGKAVCASTGFSMEEVHILTTHNHGAGEPDRDALAELAARCALQALERIRPARFRFARTATDRQRNFIRRMDIPELEGVSTLFYGSGIHNGWDASAFIEHTVRGVGEGVLRYTGAAPTMRPYQMLQPADDEITALEFRDTDGGPIGSVVRYAAHAVCANRPDSFSSDYPWHIRRHMEAALGGVGMFLNGPCGDISPGMEDKYSGKQQRLGEAVASRALDALDGKEFAAPDPFSARRTAVWLPVCPKVLSGTVSLPKELPESLPERRRLLEEMRMRDAMPFLREKYAKGETVLSGQICVHMGFLRLGEVMIAAFPGETFSATARALKDAFPEHAVMTVTEHGRTVMYMPPAEEVHKGGYEVTCRVTDDAAEEILRSAAVAAMRSFIGESAGTSS